MSEPRQLNLTGRQKLLVRDSFDSIKEFETSVLLLFYGRLFEIAPEARALFKIDMHLQSHKLLDTFSIVIESLDHFPKILPTLQDLGRKHLDYGVQTYQYDRLRTALLWAFGQALGLEFDRETRNAWEQLLLTISEAMLEAAKSTS